MTYTPDVTADHICTCGDCDPNMEDECIWANELQGIFHVIESDSNMEENRPAMLETLFSQVMKAKEEIDTARSANAPVPEDPDAP